MTGEWRKEDRPNPILLLLEGNLANGGCHDALRLLGKPLAGSDGAFGGGGGGAAIYRPFEAISAKLKVAGGATDGS